MAQSRALPLLVVPVFLLGFASARLMSPASPVPRPGTVTDSLTADLHAAWNSTDIAEMKRRLQPSAFFKSPYQLRYGREVMMETVLRSNPPVFQVRMTNEEHSYVSEHLAWSMGEIESDIYEDGRPTGRVGSADYLYVFTPDASGSWKTQMMIYHEACE